MNDKIKIAVRWNSSRPAYGGFGNSDCWTPNIFMKEHTKQLTRGGRLRVSVRLTK